MQTYDVRSNVTGIHFISASLSSNIPRLFFRTDARQRYMWILQLVSYIDRASYVIREFRPHRLWEMVVRIGKQNRAGSWIFKLYYRLDKLLRKCEEEKVRSDDQKKEDVGGTGKVEYDIAEKESRRRHVLVTER